jgi:regulator of sigma E protease
MSGVGSWLLVFLGFSLLIILHEGGHFLAAKATGMRVERFFLFFGPKLISFKRGETEYGIAAIPLGGYVKISGMSSEEELQAEVEHRAYHRQPVWKRVVVIAAGPAMNIALAFAIFFIVFFAYARQPTQVIEEVVKGTPAAGVLRPGDKILAVDGSAYRNQDPTARSKRFIDEIKSHKCPGRQVDGCRAATPVALRVERNGQDRTVLVRPEYKAADGRMLIGFGYGVEPTTVSAGTAAGQAANAVWLVASRTVSVFSRIFESSQRKEISSVVGISDVAHQTVETSAEKALLLLALVSLSLGLINLLPILPLDGGHIFWSLIEKLRGRPVPLRVIERATVVGFALVAVLMFIGLSNDIGRLTGEGFNAR